MQTRTCEFPAQLQFVVAQAAMVRHVRSSDPAYAEEVGSAYMKRPEIVIAVDVGVGPARDTVWTCDLTHEYISINADYRS